MKTNTELTAMINAMPARSGRALRTVQRFLNKNFIYFNDNKIIVT